MATAGFFLINNGISKDSEKTRIYVVTCKAGKF